MFRRSLLAVGPGVALFMAVGCPSRQGAILPTYKVSWMSSIPCSAKMRSAHGCAMPVAHRPQVSFTWLNRARPQSRTSREHPGGSRAMQFVDLSREIHHRTPTHPSHPPMVMGVWNDHSEVKSAGKTRFTSKAMALTLSDHSGTHVDAPCHFNPDPKAASIDQVPLEDFYTEAICLDLSHVPLKHEINVAEMEEALKASGQQITKRDTVLIEMGVNKRLWGTPGYLHDFPGLHVDAVHWLADKGIVMFGVEAVSPAPEGE